MVGFSLLSPNSHLWASSSLGHEIRIQRSPLNNSQLSPSYAKQSSTTKDKKYYKMNSKGRRHGRVLTSSSKLGEVLNGLKNTLSSLLALLFFSSSFSSPFFFPLLFFRLLGEVWEWETNLIHKDDTHGIQSHVSHPTLRLQHVPIKTQNDIKSTQH